MLPLFLFFFLLFMYYAFEMTYKRNVNGTRIIEPSLRYYEASFLLLFYRCIKVSLRSVPAETKLQTPFAAIIGNAPSWRRIRGKDTEIQPTSPTRRIGKIFCRDQTVSAWIESSSMFLAMHGGAKFCKNISIPWFKVILLVVVLS